MTELELRTPPEGWVKDPNSSDWWYDPANVNPNDPLRWWQMPSQGFVPDPNNPGWWYDPTKDIAHDQTAWWHDATIINDAASKGLSYWTFDEIAQAAGVPVKNVEDNWPHICRAAGIWQIADPLVLVGFLGTMMQETGSLYPVREAYWVWNVDPQAAIRYYLDTSKHAAYQGGSGWEFHGRGYVQLTHQSNYQAVQDKMAELGVPVDLVNNPDLMLTPEVAAHALCIYFVNRGLVAACQSQDWSSVRRGVYGGSDAVGVAKLQRANSMLYPLAQQRGYA